MERKALMVFGALMPALTGVVGRKEGAGIMMAKKGRATPETTLRVCKGWPTPSQAASSNYNSIDF
jgi:hypothetical protein